MVALTIFATVALELAMATCDAVVVVAAVLVVVVVQVLAAVVPRKVAWPGS